MKEHPLTLEDLEQERLYLKDAGFRLNIVQADPGRAELSERRRPERDAFVVQAQEPSLGANMVGGILGAGVGARRIHDPRLGVVRQIQLQIVGDARSRSGASTGKATSMRRNKFRSIQSALPQ